MPTQHVDKPAADVSPDGEDRIQDFLNRHGGAGSRPVAKQHDSGGSSGWSEIHAADGYVLRCDWSRFGSREEMRFTELPPSQAGASPPTSP